jgi:DNA invertase Pin-like site-specific DNA recombinase
MTLTQESAIEVAAYYRLSRESEDSASIETQRAAVRAWLVSNGYNPDTVSLTEYIDAGVSGAKPLEERKDMRRLMRDRPTVVVAWKLDRYARSVSEFLRLIAWAESHGVRLATTDNTINTATPTGRMVAVVLAALAQWERDMIAGRIKEGHATRRAQGRWGSGRPPYGYDVVRRDGAAYLAVNEDQKALIREAVQALIHPDGKGTVAGTAAMVGVSEPQWRRLLKSPTFRGQRKSRGKLVLAADGITPVQFADPIISAAESKAVVQRLNALATGQDRAPRGETPQCAGMAWCYKCAGKLNGGTSDTGTKLYRCKAGHVTIYAEALDSAVENEFMRRWGGMAEYTVRLEGGNDLSDQMEEAKEQAQRIAAQMAEAGPLMLGMLNDKAAELEATYAALRAAHDPDVREVLEPTGRTLKAAWDADETARSGLLADLGLNVVLWPKKGQYAREERLEITWAVGGDDQELVEYLSEAEAAK